MLDLLDLQHPAATEVEEAYSTASNNRAELEAPVLPVAVVVVQDLRRKMSIVMYLVSGTAETPVPALHRVEEMEMVVDLGRDGKILDQLAVVEEEEGVHVRTMVGERWCRAGRARRKTSLMPR